MGSGRLGRPCEFVRDAQRDRQTALSPVPALNTLLSVAQARSLLDRRSIAWSKDQDLPAVAMRQLQAVLYGALESYDWLRAGIVVQGAEGTDRGSYLLLERPRRLDKFVDDVSEQLILTLSQGQKFALGRGMIVLLGSWWPERPATFSHPDYASRLTAIGVIGQALVNTAWTLGLGGRMTPAINEDAALEIFAEKPADRRGDFLYMLKLGVR